MTTHAGDEVKQADELRQQAAVTMTTSDAEDKYHKANKLLSEVDVNIVKTATLRKQMPVKCAQLLAKRCRFQYRSIEKQSVKCAESLSAAAAAASFEPQVDDETLQSLQSRVIKLKDDLHKLSATSRHLTKAQQMNRINSRILSLINDSAVKDSETDAVKCRQ